MIELIKQPWPWYISGPLIGLVVPMLLILSNKQFGISSSFKQLLCYLPLKKISYFNYDFKKDNWILLFVFGISLGAFVGYYIIGVPNSTLNPEMIPILSNLGVKDFSGLLPNDYFLLIPNSVAGLILTLGGGVLIGFGTRWANGCTGGHTIMGLAQFSRTSFIATICFFIGGIISARILMPLLLHL